MPFSSLECKDKIGDWIQEINPKEVMDVGPGCGTYSDLFRKKTNAVWIGLEIFYPYVQQFNLKSKYDGIIISDARFYDWGSEQGLDLTIIGDCLEHMDYADAIKLVEKISRSSKNLIVSVPLGRSPQGEHNGNEFETHVSTWTMDHLKTIGYRGYVIKDLIKGKEIGAIWLESTEA